MMDPARIASEKTPAEIAQAIDTLSEALADPASTKSEGQRARWRRCLSVYLDAEEIIASRSR
jgi:hypothetical protein